MQKQNILWANHGHYISEVPSDTTAVDLKGDMFLAEINPQLSPEELKAEELIFDQRVETEGVFGYILYKVGPEQEIIDSCFGFLGRYGSENEHYIVGEYIDQIIPAYSPTTLKEIDSFYLDYFNNYLTVEKIAEHNGLNEGVAASLINIGRMIRADRE